MGEQASPSVPSQQTFHEHLRALTRACRPGGDRRSDARGTQAIPGGRLGRVYPRAERLAPQRTCEPMIWEIETVFFHLCRACEHDAVGFRSLPACLPFLFTQLSAWCHNVYLVSLMHSPNTRTQPVLYLPSDIVDL